MKSTNKILPRLLLIGAAVLLLDVVMELSLILLRTDIKEGMSSAAIVIHLARQLPFMVVCFYLAFIARDYYAGSDAFRAKIFGFRCWTWALCGIYALECLYGSCQKLMLHHQAPGSFYLFFVVTSMLQFLPVVAGLLLMQDLLVECLVLRDETSLTV